MKVSLRSRRPEASPSRTHRVLGDYPLDVTAYARQQDIAVYLARLDDEGLDGFALAGPDRREITLNRDSGRLERRVACAHLLGHILAAPRGAEVGVLLHQSTGCCADWEFAESLLCPRGLVDAALDQGMTLREVASLFEVPLWFLAPR